MSRSVTAEMHAIDISTAHQRLIEADTLPSLDEIVRTDAYADLGGLSAVPDSSSHGPRVFTDFAEILQADERKYDIARGLGGLGLIAVSTADIMSMRKADRSNYALALGDYHYAIGHRSRVLATVGSIDSDAFQHRYADTDQVWASQYASELSRLQGTLSATRLFAYTERIAGPRTERQKAAGLTKGWELQTDGNGRFAVHKPASRTRRAA